MARTQLAMNSGLSHASITAICSDLIAQGILVDLHENDPASKSRGRPAVRLTFNRQAAYFIIVELDVNRARFSLIDYSETLVDRIEAPLAPTLFLTKSPVDFISEQLSRVIDRNPEIGGRLVKVSVSVQGILSRDGEGLAWSPIANLSGHNLVGPLSERHPFRIALYKRGPLLAEGTRILHPALQYERVATIYVGSTVAMGITSNGRPYGRGNEGATEFGHMNHVPGGALCRCGMRGCLEAYAADYGVLRTAYSVPERTPPAAAVPPGQYQDLIRQAKAGRRNAVRGFNMAGQAIGYGLGRLMTVFDPSYIFIVGPGAAAFDLMLPEMEAALSQSLVCKVNGMPRILAQHDEREPIYQGLAYMTLNDIDWTYFAPMAVTDMRA